MWISRKLFALSTEVTEKFGKYASFSPTPLSLKKLKEERDLITSTRFLRTELPVRVANILQEIHLLPNKLIKTPSASIVTSWYEQSFSELISFENDGDSKKECEAYLEYLDECYSKHTTVVETMACGVMEMQETHGGDAVTNQQIQYFLDRLFMMRISIRMLISQHLLVFGDEKNAHRRFVGCIDPNCNVVEILKDAFNDSKLLCDHYYADSPELNISLCNDVNGVIELVYVPSHLYHILFELLKNAMRAIVERGQLEKKDVFPPIDVLIVNGQHNVTIKISDKGGGFPNSFVDLLFRYTYTTAGGSSNKRSSPETHSPSGYAPIAGYGYGLPLSRLYARYFHGDLRLSGLEGYGTDAIVYLMRRSTEADEMLPIFNRTSARRYESASVPVNDWSSPKTFS